MIRTREKRTVFHPPKREKGGQDQTFEKEMRLKDFQKLFKKKSCLFTPG